MDLSLVITSPPRVEFVNIVDQHNTNEDLTFIVRLDHEYNVQEGDRVALYKFGWTEMKEYVLFEWVPPYIKVNEIPFRFSSRTLRIVYKEMVFPKSSNELFQFCYINGSNIVKGASIPFHFNDVNLLSEGDPAESKPNLCFKKILDDIDTLKQNVTNMWNDSTESDSSKPNNLDAYNIAEGRADDVPKEGTPPGSYCIDMENVEPDEDEDEEPDLEEILLNHKEELKSVRIHFRHLLHEQARFIDLLKIKFDKGAEEYRKLFIEKVIIENKYNKLKKKNKKERKSSESRPESEFGDLKSLPNFHVEESENNDDFDIGDFEPLPKFPEIHW